MKKRIKRTLLLLVIALFLCPISFTLLHRISRNGIPVLGYHNIVSDEEKRTLYRENHYTLSVSALKKHFDYLKRHHYRTLTLIELEDYLNHAKSFDQKVVVLTFDDGYASFNTLVKPLLESYDFHATCFVIGHHLHDENPMYLKQHDLINDEHVAYYSHSYDLHHQAGRSKKRIETLTPEEIAADFQHNSVDQTYFAFPYGRSTDQIDRILHDQGVHLAFSYNQYEHVTDLSNRYYLPRYMIIDLMPMLYFQWILNEK